jgi:phage-related protein
VKHAEFLGTALKDLKAFPDDARKDAGFQIDRVQRGRDPSDWKPMPNIGPGVREIRIREASGAFRVIYLANLRDRIVVLHAFQKKSQKTAQTDIDIAASRLRLLQSR